MIKTIEMPENLHSAVLLITFNRPGNTRKVFETIQLAKVSKLYVFNDGPREGNAKDVTARIEIQDLLTQIDWQCDLRVNFPEKNNGCAAGVTSAIDWAFENEDRLVILEDDCVPSLSFFNYCDTLLERYKADTRVWMISGNNYNEEFKLDYSYTFSHNAVHIWGWATWKRSWKHYCLKLDNWPSFRRENGLESIFATGAEVSFWKNRYDRLYADREIVIKSTWDYQYVLSLFVNGGLCIVPAQNLVKNIGVEGMHTNSKNAYHGRHASESFEIVSHPLFILVNRAYDSHHLKHHWMSRKPVLTRINNKIRNTIKS